MSHPTCEGQRKQPTTAGISGHPALHFRLLSVVFRQVFTDRTPTAQRARSAWCVASRISRRARACSSRPAVSARDRLTLLRAVARRASPLLEVFLPAGAWVDYVTR